MRKIHQILKFARMGIMMSVSLMVLAACDNGNTLSEQKGNFYFSNPTKEIISFKIDDQSYEVEPYTSGKVELSPGMHQMENKDGQVTKFMVFDNNNGGILNPESQIYYELAMAYVVGGKGKSFMPATYSIMINGHEMRIPVRSANEPIIDGKLFSCDYPLGEALPAEITTYNPNIEGRIQNKCFDKRELIEFLKSDFHMDLTISKDKNRDDPTLDSITDLFSEDIPQAQFLDEKTQAIAIEIVSLLTMLKTTEDTAIHSIFNEEFASLLTELVMTHINSQYAGDKAQNELYNDFIEQASNLQSYGVLIR